MRALEITGVVQEHNRWVPVEQPEPPRIENRIQLPNPADEDRWYRPPAREQPRQPTDRGIFIIEF